MLDTTKILSILNAKEVTPKSHLTLPSFTLLKKTISGIHHNMEGQNLRMLIMMQDIIKTLFIQIRDFHFLKTRKLIILKKEEQAEMMLSTSLLVIPKTQTNSMIQLPTNSKFQAVTRKILSQSKMSKLAGQIISSSKSGTPKTLTSSTIEQLLK